MKDFNMEDAHLFDEIGGFFKQLNKEIILNASKYVEEALIAFFVS